MPSNATPPQMSPSRDVSHHEMPDVEALGRGGPLKPRLPPMRPEQTSHARNGPRWERLLTGFLAVTFCGVLLVVMSPASASSFIIEQAPIKPADAPDVAAHMLRPEDGRGLQEEGETSLSPPAPPSAPIFRMLALSGSTDDISSGVCITSDTATAAPCPSMLYAEW